MSYLVLGDGNFSFSLALSRHALTLPGACRVVATSLESLPTVLTRAGAEENLKLLTTIQGVEVIHEVDATKLHVSFKDINVPFHTIVFNFPHAGGKSKVQSNRALLRDLFVSITSSNILASDGEIHVTLCRGQGGTPADDTSRGYKNSWQVVEMAAEGGLVLDHVEPFSPQTFWGYSPTGYRGHSDNGFCLSGALRHVFRLPSPRKPSLYPPTYIHDVSFWCTVQEGFGANMLGDVVDEVVGGGGGVRGGLVVSVELLEIYRPSNDGGSEGCDGVCDKVCIEEGEVCGGDCGDVCGGDGEMCGGDGAICDRGGGESASRIGYCYRLSYQSSWDSLCRSKAAHLQISLRQALQSIPGLEVR